MKRILLVRHCQSEHHVNEDARDWPDCRNGLTELGCRQAEALAARLKRDVGGCACRIYAGTQARAAQTAEIIAAALSAQPGSAPELRGGPDRLQPDNPAVQPAPAPEPREWGNPAPEGAKAEAIGDPNGDRTAWLFDTRLAAGIETWREFHARVCRFMDRLAGTLRPDILPIRMTHGGTLSNIVVWWLSLPLDALPERTCFAGSPASVSVLRRNEYDHPVIERLNDRSHLHEAGFSEDMLGVLENPGPGRGGKC